MHAYSCGRSFHFLSMLSLAVSLSLARQCAQLWLKTRESLGHPLGITSEPEQLVCPKEILQAAVQRVSLYLLVTCIVLHSFCNYHGEFYQAIVSSC